MPKHPPIPVGTPVAVCLSWIESNGYITKVYGEEDFPMKYSWHYYDVVLFSLDKKHRKVFGTYLVDLRTGLREDGSPYSYSG